MTEHVDILSETELFHEIHSADLGTSLQGLEDGDMFPITHGWLAGKFGDETIMVDPAMRSGLSPQGRFTQIKGIDHLRSNLDSTAYSHSIFGTESPEQVAQNTARFVDKILITHLDSDHIDFDLIVRMMESNPNLTVYGPLGWQTAIGKTHVFEGEQNPKKKPVLPEHIRTRLHGLSPVHTLGDKPKGLAPDREKNPALYDSLHTIRYEHNGVPTTITSYEIPHLASKHAELVQGFLIESADSRELILPDAALSAEIIHLVASLHEQSPLTKITMSSAKFNPEPFLEIPISKTKSINPISAAVSDRVRNTLEEPTGHSAYLPFILASVTNGETSIEMVHFGLYHNSIPDTAYIPNRISFSGNIDIHAWYSHMKSMVQTQFDKQSKAINSLGSLSGTVHSMKDIMSRFTFTKAIVSYFQKNPPPEDILESLGGPLSLPIPMTAAKSAKGA